MVVQQLHTLQGVGSSPTVTTKIVEHQVYPVSLVAKNSDFLDQQHGFESHTGL